MIYQKTTKIKDFVNDIQDFPKPGVVFKDINPLLKHQFSETLEEMSSLLSPHNWNNIDSIAGVESRGFILASGLASKMKKGVLPIRKPGKLPGEIHRISYDLEYGKSTLEMNYGSGNILIVDDVLATGGTLKAACELSLKTNHWICGIIVLINLKYLNTFSWNGITPKSLIDYEN